MFVYTYHEIKYGKAEGGRPNKKAAPAIKLHKINYSYVFLRDDYDNYV